MLMGHGGNIHALAARLNCPAEAICDMSSNVNPFGPPEGLMDYLRAELGQITSLPEVDAGEMRRAFAARYALDPRTVLAGNGSTQLIHLLPEALGWRKVAIAGPTYADYADACRMQAISPVLLAARRQEGFRPNLDALSAAADQAEALFICNPNNPTGAQLAREHLLALCAAHPDTTIVVDESYLPFVHPAAEHTLLGCGLSNLIVINSMSKIFRLPGLRIGFIHARQTTIDRLQERLPPWSVNALAQSAVRYLMQAEEAMAEFIKTSCRRLDAARDTFCRDLGAIRGLEIFPSRTSFLLMRLPEGLTAASVWEAMAEARVLIRDCSNFEGLGERYIRLSLKDEVSNRWVAELLMQMLAMEGKSL
jgi:threonine-phosphate decarboxylase